MSKFIDFILTFMFVGGIPAAWLISYALHNDSTFLVLCIGILIFGLVISVFRINELCDKIDNMSGDISMLKREIDNIHDGKDGCL